MRLAVLADIHGNLRALRACLDHAQAAGAEHFAVLGDLVGYGAEPGAVVGWAQDAARAGALVLRGNHDHAAAHPPGEGPSAEHASTVWTRAQLSDGQRDFLAGLPLQARYEDVLLVHASPHEPGRWHYLDRPERALQALRAAEAGAGVRGVLAGHVHEQRLYYRGRAGGLLPFTPTAGIPIPLRPHPVWVATAGAVGQPRDGDVRAMYALLDTAADTLCFHRVPYDHLAAARAIRATPLPASFADRLEQGR
jgi:diadenosine tetraphosphatase ApaH/serine/threonine PP2A family protein phosphatase